MRHGMPWTRREALGVIAAFASICAGSLPSMAAAAREDGLRSYARRVGADPDVAQIGRLAAGGRDMRMLETSLRARVPGLHDEAGWRDGLLQAARADLVAGSWRKAGDRRMLEVEADFLALAALLQAGIGATCTR